MPDAEAPYDIAAIEAVSAAACEASMAISLSGAMSSQEALKPDLWAAELRYFLPNMRTDWHRLRSMLEAFRPTHIVLQAPLLNPIRWARKHRVKILPVFDQRFENGTQKEQLLNRALAVMLRHQAVPFVANRRFSACQTLSDIGVPKSKLIPWDEITGATPNMTEPRKAPKPPFRLIYAGHMTEEAGVSDVIDAIITLNHRGHDVTAGIYGQGTYLEKAMIRAAQAQIANKIGFFADPSEKDLLQAFDEAHVNLLPSRPEDKAGLPLTLASSLTRRIPLVVSNHRMFKRLAHGGAHASIAKSAQPGVLADRIEAILRKPGLYKHLSEKTESIWQDIQCPTDFSHLMLTWMSGTEKDDLMLQKMTLKSLAQKES